VGGPRVKITTETVRRVAAHAQRLTAGTHGLAFVAKPGDPPRYVDKRRPTTREDLGAPEGFVFTGGDAARRAAAFYAGIVDTLPGANPPLTDRVLDEVTTRHAQAIEVGRRCAVRHLGTHDDDPARPCSQCRPGHDRGDGRCERHGRLIDTVNRR
jgi:hypothetical protein